MLILVIDLEIINESELKIENPNKIQVFKNYDLNMHHGLKITNISDLNQFFNKYLFLILIIINKDKILLIDGVFK